MSCFSNKSISEETIDDILEGSQKILDFSEDALGLVPIPGLGPAAGALSSIIEMVKVGTRASVNVCLVSHVLSQKARGNVDTRKDLAEHIKGLAEALERAHAVAQAQPEGREKVMDHLKSPELKERLDKLAQYV